MAVFPPARPRTQARLGCAYVTWRQFTANRLAVVGLFIIIALLLMAAFADVLATHSPVVGDLRNARLRRPARRAIFSVPTTRAATSTRA